MSKQECQAPAPVLSALPELAPEASCMSHVLMSSWASLLLPSPEGAQYGPLPTEAQKCELICQSEDTGDVVFMNQVVHDGTRCSYRDPYSICARGECVVGAPLPATHPLPAPGN